MKKIPLLGAVLFFLTSPLGAEDNGTLLYRFEGTPVTSRLAFLKAQAPALLTDEFLLRALTMTDELGIESGPQSESDAKKDTAVWLCQMLTQRKNTEAVAVYRRLADQYKDPLLRGEAYLDLAKMGDKQVVPDLIRQLRSLNSGAQRNRADEILAYALVQACGELTAGETFSEVLKASRGWYSPQSQVKETARRILPKLSGGFTDNLLAVLKGDDDLSNRETAFQYLIQNFETSTGARAATAALEAARTLQPRDPKDRELVDRLRKGSLRYLQNVQPPAESLAVLKFYMENPVSDQEDRVLTVRILGRITGEESASVLANQLKRLNQRQKSGGNTGDDVDLVRELISVLGPLGGTKAKEALAETEFSNYTPAVVQEARNALKKAGGE